MTRGGRTFHRWASAFAVLLLFLWLSGCSKDNCSGVPGKAAVVLVMDYSGSMSNNDVRNAEIAAREFIIGMTDEDVGKIIKFSSNFYVHPEDRFVGKAELLRLLETGKNGRGGATRLYGSMQRGLTDLVAQTNRSLFRRALIAFTDGNNNQSPDSSAVDPMIATARAEDITIYTIGLGNVDKDELERLAVETGGRFVFTAKSEEMRAIYESIAEELHKCSDTRGYLL